MSQYDTQTLHEFLAQTPESALRKMLLDRQLMTDAHCGLLFKLVKSCDAATFGLHLDRQDFPRVRMSPAEEKIKEKFWETCTATLLERGILQPSSTQKLAA